MTFTATESSSAPVVLGKEPISRPKIERGAVQVPLAAFDAFPERGSRITFKLIRGPFVLTYHSVRVHDHDSGTVSAWVSPDDVVTWIELDASN
jgi:hypothetical protein